MNGPAQERAEEKTIDETNDVYENKRHKKRQDDQSNDVDENTATYAWLPIYVLENKGGYQISIHSDKTCSVDLRSTTAVGDRRYNHNEQAFMPLRIVAPPERGARAFTPLGHRTR